MFENIDFEKYLGKTYEELYDDFFELIKSNQRKLKDGLDLYIYDDKYITVDKDYNDYVLNMVGNVMIKQQEKKSETRKVVNHLFDLWILQLKHKSLEADLPLNRKEFDSKPLKKAAYKLIEQHCDDKNLNPGKRKYLSSVMMLTNEKEVDEKIFYRDYSFSVV